MKIRILIIAVTIFCFSNSILAQNTYVPDDNFEQALIDLGYDTGALNDSVPTDSIKNIGYLNLNYKKISNLTGIEDFTNLTKLYCYNNQLTELNLESNILLEELNCSYNNLIDLDLSSNLSLTNFNATRNQLTGLNLKNGNNSNLTINVINNPDLLCIEVDDAETAYTYTNWQKNAYAGYSEDCSSYKPEMTYVPDDNFEQALIDLGYDTGALNDSVPTVAIKEVDNLYLNYRNIRDFTGIEDFTKITYLSCYNNRLTELNLNSNILLEELNCSYNNLIDLDLSSNFSLTRFTGENNQLTGLNLKNGNNSNLIIDVRNNPDLLCIQVDDADASYTYANWYKNAYAGYSEDCSSYKPEMTYVPDDNFEQALIDFGYDTGTLNDSVPTVAIKEVDNLNLNYRNIRDLTGIEDFTKITYLSCYNNRLTELNLNSNILLEELNCSYNNLIDLDLSSNFSLTRFTGENNQLTGLNLKNGNNSNLIIDVRNNPDLLCIQVDDADASYTYANWYKNAYAGYSEDCSNYKPEMTYVPDDNFEQALIDKGYDWGDVNDSVLTAVVSSIHSISLCHQEIKNLTGIEDFKSLGFLDCSGNKLTNLNLELNNKLTSLWCENNKISELNLSANVNLEKVICNHNNIVNLDVSSNYQLGRLECEYNQLTELNIQNGNTTLALKARHNNNLLCIQVDDVEAAYSLYSIWDKDGFASFSEDCSNNQIQMIYVPDDNFEQTLINSRFDNGELNDSVPLNAVKYIKSFYLYEKGISDLTGIEYFSSLQYLNLKYNKLTELNLCSNKKLSQVFCEYNQLSSLNVSENNSLIVIDCNNNNLNEIHLPSSDSLVRLNCENNQLDSLDLSSTVGLKFLICNNNKLNFLGISSNILLTELQCKQNNLMDLDFRNHKDLYSLNCESNDLRSLKIDNGNNLHLNSVDATNNPSLTCIQVDDVDYANTTIGYSNWNKDETASYSENCGNLGSGIPIEEYNSLVDLYNSTLGEEWTIGDNWLDTINSTVDDWYGVTVEDGHVTQILLSGNNLQNTAFENQVTLPKLRYLDLGNNSLTGFNFSVIDSLQKLDTFALYQNSLIFEDLIPAFSTFIYPNYAELFSYSDQAKVDYSENVGKSVNEQFSFTVSEEFISANDQFQWYKDGVKIDGETDSVINFSPVTKADSGSYYVEITNPGVPDLILRSHYKSLYVTDNPETSVPVSEYNALVDFYNSLDGDNWTRNDNWLDTINHDINDWYGVTVEDGHVAALWLSKNNLSGIIPNTIGNLSALQNLHLGYNKIHGNIPAEIGNLTNLISLALNNNNNISGSIPKELGNLSNLDFLDLSGNNLSGSFPKELGNLDKLQTLYLNFNRISGLLPPEIGNLSELRDFKIYNNTIQGPLPAELSQLNKLETFYIDANWIGKIVDESIPREARQIPDILGEMKALKNFNIAHNYLLFNDIEPIFLWPNYNNLIEFRYEIQTSLHKNIEVTADPGETVKITIPNYYPSASDTYQWMKDGNPITGANDSTLELTNVQLEDEGLYYCVISNNVATNLELHVYSTTLKVNDVHGAGIPLAEYNALVEFYNTTNGENWRKKTNWLDTINCTVAAWEGIEVLNKHVYEISMDTNNVSGSFPTALYDLHYLERICFYMNDLSGNLPDDIDKLTKLRTLYLSDNKLSGNIPESIGKLTNLEHLNLDNNNFEGNIPNSLGNLPNLFQLSIQNNSLTGVIPSNIGNLTNLIALNLSNNQLTGPVPAELKNLTKVYRIELENNLIGHSNLGEKSANALNSRAGNNRQIPDELADLISMDTFRLGNNNLQFNDIEAIFSWNNFNDFKDFIYYPQGSIGVTKTISAEADQKLLLYIENYFPGNSDKYQWYKNGNLIPNAKDATLSLIGLKLSDAGEYHCKVTNRVATKLTLTSKTITLEVTEANAGAGVPVSEYLALVEIYNSTNGNSWTNNLNWLDTISVTVNNWFGITVENGHVTKFEMPNNNLSKIPTALKDLPELKKIDLSGLNLEGTVSPVFAQLDSLGWLDLSNNNLSGEIPPFSNTKNENIKSKNSNKILTYLNIANNNFRFIDLEPNASDFFKIDEFIYAPQQSIGQPLDTFIYKYDTITFEIENYIHGSFDSNKWFKNGQEITGKNGLTFTIENAALQDSGYYTYSVTNTLFTDLTLNSDTCRLKVLVPANINNQLLSKFKVYPNPANKRVYFDTKNETIGIKVFNLTGKLILEKGNFQSGWIDINQFPRGVYIFRAIRKNFETENIKVIFR